MTRTGEENLEILNSLQKDGILRTQVRRDSDQKMMSMRRVMIILRCNIKEAPNILAEVKGPAEVQVLVDTTVANFQILKIGKNLVIILHKTSQQGGNTTEEISVSLNILQIKGKATLNNNLLKIRQEKADSTNHLKEEAKIPM